MCKKCTYILHKLQRLRKDMSLLSNADHIKYFGWHLILLQSFYTVREMCNHFFPPMRLIIVLELYDNQAGTSMTVSTKE